MNADGGDDVLLTLRSLLAGDGSPVANIYARNTALDTNRPIADNNITANGSSWMWAVTALHAFLFICVLGLMMKTKHRQRVYHYLALAILLVPTIAYFTMASNLGGTPVPVEFRQRGLTERSRQIFWVRFVEWTITWSLITLALLLMTAVGWSTIIWTIGLSILYAVMLLVGALTQSSYKWGYFVFALLAYFLLAYQLLHVARPWARRYETSRYYFPAAAYILFFWLLYPISWGLSEGGNVITNDGECVFYGVLDIFSKGLFALGLVYLARKLDFKRLGLWMHDHGRISPGYGETGYHEKMRAAPGVAGTGAGRESSLGNEGYESRGVTGLGATRAEETV
ncbi:hypothetical protein EV426DRAFT_552669 [Tirmania nivea]|nr:hypothetical protein EV426DRAFT_552669 [Tirmania nivea]